MNIARTFEAFFLAIFSYLPNIIGFLLILLVGYLIAKLLRTLVNKALDRMRVDQTLQRSKAGQLLQKVSPGGRAAHLIGALVFWLVFIYALTAAVGALQIPSVTEFMNLVLSYLPNVVAAVLIFIVAAALAAGVVALVQRTMGDTPTGKLVETTVPALILAIAGFMILNQLGIAPEIVIITYAALIGMLALAGALAFGLGGREVAAQMWQQAYTKGQQQAAQARQDVQAGKARAQQQLQTAVQGQAGQGGYSEPSTQSIRVQQPPAPTGDGGASAWGQHGQPQQPQYGQPAQPGYGQPGQPEYGQPGQPGYGQQ